MHRRASPRISAAPQTGGVLAFAALIGGNVALAFGPWLVRLADTGPVAAAFWRLTLAAPVLIALSLRSGWRPAAWSWRLWLMTALGAACFAGDLGSWHLGILRTTLANASLFGNSTTILFPIYGFIAARTPPTRAQAGALLLAFIGALLLMGQSYQLDSSHLGGDLLCILAGLLYTVYLALMAHVRATTPPMPALALSTVMSIAPALLFALALGERVFPQHWGPLVGLAFVSQILGQGLMLLSLGRFPPLVIGLALLTQPIVAATVGWVWYGEALGPADIVGALLVAVALVMVRARRAPVATEGAKHQNTGGDL
ncbi:DMT family transporter [Sphingomonas sp. H39-1-10]|uniref:DMT family transporter n=1 Tax=Sphingomonas TaxID=13687 RepID=UPI000884275E|nr:MULTISPECIES: DMT family transporter [Sphingomonas]MDF0488125.1 DMT family transporter [Sphingomonas pollutisoli]SDA33606.1 Threonine/homoserine efflux transporter RhtA [Sphingomonas sp. NFR15]